jgi:hypothetical protein
VEKFIAAKKEEGRILLNNLQTFRDGASKVKENNMVERKGQTTLFIFKSLTSCGICLQFSAYGLLLIITH